MNKKQFHFSIENFRGIAIVLVVLTHLQFSHRFQQSNLIVFLVGNATAFFVFISGFLFYLTENKRFEYAAYLGKKLKVVILPYLLISFVDIVYALFKGKNVTVSMTKIGYSFWTLLVGGTVSPQLWFMPMIICFFLLSPLFIYVSHIKRSNYLTALTVISLLISLFSDRPFSNLNPLLSAIHFSGFYFLGIYIAANYDALIKLKYLLFTIGLVIFIGSMFLIGENNAGTFFEDNFLKFNDNSFSKLGMTLFIFFGLATWGNGKNYLLGYLANISFGMFFIHTHCRVLLSLFFHNELEKLDPIYYSIIEISFVLISSALVIEAIKLVFGNRSRYVIGC